MRERPAATGLWELARGAAGLGFVAAAAFNTVVTLRQPQVFLAPARRDVWLPPWRFFLERIMTRHPRRVVLATIAYEASVAALILARGRPVRVGIAGAMVWAGVTTPVLPPGQAAGNAALIPALAPLLSRSYPRTTWAVVGRLGDAT